MTTYAKKQVAKIRPRPEIDGLEIMRRKRAHPEIDWPAYEAAKERLVKNQTVEDSAYMNDLQVVKQGDITLLSPDEKIGIRNRESMIKAVKVLYPDKPEPVLMATSLLCWELGLSPEPSMGHVWVFQGKKGWLVMIGILGLLNIANRSHDYIVRPARPMTDEERANHDLGPDDVGVIVPVVDLQKARKIAELRQMGMVELTVEDASSYGTGIWRKGDNVWATGTPFEVAKKRGLAQAIKRLGLLGNVGMLPNLMQAMRGAEYDGEAGYIIDAPSEAPRNNGDQRFQALQDRMVSSALAYTSRDADESYNANTVQTEFGKLFEDLDEAERFYCSVFGNHTVTESRLYAIARHLLTDLALGMEHIANWRVSSYGQVSS